MCLQLRDFLSVMAKAALGCFGQRLSFDISLDELAMYTEEIACAQHTYGNIAAYNDTFDAFLHFLFEFLFLFCYDSPCNILFLHLIPSYSIDDNSIPQGNDYAKLFL